MTAWVRGEGDARLGGPEPIHLHAWSADVVPLRLWHNPWAALPLGVELPWAPVAPDLAANELVRREATATPAELLGLSTIDGPVRPICPPTLL